MPKSSNRRQHPEEPRSVATRASILAAAERAFAESGLAGARTEAIAAAAGVNKALLYYYFKSKEALYEAVLKDHLREFNRRALEVLSGSGPARDVLLRYVGLHFDFISARHRYAPLVQQLLSSGGRLPERLVRKYFKARSEAFIELLDRGMRAGEFRPADRWHTAVSIVALIVFYFSCAPVLELLGQADAYSTANLRRRKQEVLDFIRYSLFVEPKTTTS
ncbi:MAG TPA: TetR/AcrR family transcriptional regulator [Candidatus Limnocylindrales bacterium]|nr:TetR/AcrR family transcriptional regulator [Candidatus Limnocylindrales bacterium]